MFRLTRKLYKEFLLRFLSNNGSSTLKVPVHLTTVAVVASHGTIIINQAARARGNPDRLELAGQIRNADFEFSLVPVVARKPCATGTCVKNGDNAGSAGDFPGLRAEYTTSQISRANRRSFVRL